MPAQKELAPHGRSDIFLLHLSRDRAPLTESETVGTSSGDDKKPGLSPVGTAAAVFLVVIVSGS
ncbi:hypothetical protein [Solemya velum gill symbiont]|uniref:hypothetical protein n=1 Tax=Solemya velum gill symbiont TaxID=2340 RepID=UPI00117B0FC6|nr:hypothetical protein [Solemya velum gill symbiont]